MILQKSKPAAERAHIMCALLARPIAAQVDFRFHGELFMKVLFSILAIILPKRAKKKNQP